MTANPFSYALDYDQAIAADERTIAYYTAMEPLSKDLRSDEYFCAHVSDFLADPERGAARRAMVGVTDAMWACALVRDEGGADAAAEQAFFAMSAEERREADRAYRAVLLSIGAMIEPEHVRASALTLAKARLARHRRNKAKRACVVRNAT